MHWASRTAVVEAAGPFVTVHYPAYAWVQAPEGLFRVEGEAVSVTPDAVLVRWKRSDGLPLEAWVWRAAVRHRG